MKMKSFGGKRIGRFAVLVPFLMGALLNAGEDEKAPMTVEAMVVQRGEIAEVLEYFGTVAGYEEAQVYPDMPGKLLEYTVKEGDEVEKDQVIAKLDRSVPGLEFKPLLVKSPIRGIVGILYLKPGQAVAPQVPLAFISNTESLDVLVEMPETDLNWIRIGDEVDVYLDSNVKIPGKVHRIAHALNPMSRMGTVKIRLLRRPSGLRPGTLVRVMVKTRLVKSALKVPLRALVRTDSSNYVFVVEGGRARRRVVETGLVSRGWVEIKSGLQEGDTVVTLGAAGLQDGETVRIRGEIK